MIMIFKRLLQKLLPLPAQKAGKDKPVSIILLLRQPHFFATDELRAAAEKAWGITFTEEEHAENIITQSGKLTLLKVGPHLLNFFHYRRPYVDNPKVNVGWLPKEEQRQAWAEHKACVGVDYLNKDTVIELAYCALAKVAAEMLDDNCAGIYFPGKNVLAPNDGDLYGKLQKMASSEDSGRRTGSARPA